MTTNNTNTQSPAAPIPVGVLSFHGGGEESGARPHPDELVAAILLLILRLVAFNPQTVTIFGNNNVFRKPGNADLARKMFEEGDPELNGARWLFLGWTPGDGNWNPYDEHGDRDAAEGAEGGMTSATMAAAKAGLSHDQFVERLRGLFTGIGVPDKFHAYYYQGLVNALTYIDVKDATPTAMQMGWSWVAKQIGRAAVYQRVEDRIVEMSYGQDAVRLDLYWTQVLLTTYTFLPFSPPERADKEVEKVMVGWYLSAPDEVVSRLWKPEGAQSFQDILDHIEAEYAKMMAAWEKGGKKGKEPGYPTRLVKKVETLHQHLIDMGNPVPWAETDRWAAERWFARKGNPRPLRMQEGEELAAYVERLRAYRKHLVEEAKKKSEDNEVKNVDKALSGLGELLNTGDGKFKSRIEGEKDTRAVLKGREWLDERSPKSPYGIHNTLHALLAREQTVVQGADDKRGLLLKLPEGTVKEYARMALRAWWSMEDLRDLAVTVEVQAGRREKIAVTWGIEADEKGKPSVFMADSCNPQLAPVVRSQAIAACCITTNKIGACYFGSDQRRLGAERADLMYRWLAAFARALEYMHQGRRVPEDPTDLMHGGKAAEGVWYLHIAEGKAVNLMARSLHHRASPPTRIENDHLWAILQVVSSAWLSVGHKARLGASEMVLDHQTAERILAVVWKRVFGPAILTEAKTRLLAQPSWLQGQITVVGRATPSPEESTSDSEEEGK